MRFPGVISQWNILMMKKYSFELYKEKELDGKICILLQTFSPATRPLCMLSYQVVDGRYKYKSEKSGKIFCFAFTKSLKFWNRKYFIPLYIRFTSPFVKFFFGKNLFCLFRTVQTSQNAIIDWRQRQWWGVLHSPN